MDNNILNLIVLLVCAIAWLIDALVVDRGRRVLKGSGGFLTFINIAFIISAFSQIFAESVNITNVAILTLVTLVLTTLLRYFRGVEYTIKTQDEDPLIETIEKSLKEILQVEIEKYKHEKKVVFSITNRKESLELKIHESIISSKKAYTIIFKKWLNLQTRNEITDFIEYDLQSREEMPPKKLRTALNIIGAFITIGISLYGISFSVMEPNRVDVVTKNHIPQEIYIINTDSSYTDPEGLLRFHESFLYSRATKLNGITPDTVDERTSTALTYGYNGRTLYVGEQNVSYLYVKYSDIKDTSPFHWVCWKIHNLYNSEEGMYYLVYTPSEVYNIIQDIAFYI